MTNLTFCPKCGQNTLKWDGEKKWHCPECGFTLYNNVAGAVAVLIRYKDELLLTQRNQDPGKGKLDLPGGFTDPKESAEETCKRELYEEMSIEINIKDLKYLGSGPNVYHYKEIDYNTLDLFFEYRIQEKFTAKLEASEISNIRWMEIREIDLDEIAFDSQKIFLAKYLKYNQ